MRVAVIGAGFSGIVAARTLRQFDVDAVVYDRTPDIGGVWSATRSYPGISTQNDKATYAFSDVPMPAAYPENPNGDQVRGYLEGYVRHHGLEPLLRLDTEVLRCEPADTGWRLEIRDADGAREERFDAVIMATGVYSTPHVPLWTGRAAFEAAGGRVLTPSDLHTVEQTAGRSVAVVGWGKSACDIAVAVADTAVRTTVIARTMRWKVPRRVGRLPLYRQLLLSRAGQWALWHPAHSWVGRAAYPLLRLPRGAVLFTLERLIIRDQGLRPLDLLPDGHLPNTISQPTTGLHERIADGRVQVRRGARIEALGTAEDGGPAVLLADGSIVPADLLVAATGYEQDLDVLGRDVIARLEEADGALRLYRGIRAAAVPGLYFAGYAASMFSPLSAEVSALWIAAAMTGRLRLPEDAVQEREGVPFYLTHDRAERFGTVPQVPGQAIADLDQLLADLGAPLPSRVRMEQWLRVLDPTDYRGALARVLQRAPSATPSSRTLGTAPKGGTP